MTRKPPELQSPLEPFHYSWFSLGCLGKPCALCRCSFRPGGMGKLFPHLDVGPGLQDRVPAAVSLAQRCENNICFQQVLLNAQRSSVIPGTALLQMFHGTYFTPQHLTDYLTVGIKHLLSQWQLVSFFSRTFLCPDSPPRTMSSGSLQLRGGRPADVSSPLCVIPPTACNRQLPLLQSLKHEGASFSGGS